MVFLVQCDIFGQEALIWASDLQGIHQQRGRHRGPLSVCMRSERRDAHRFQI